MQTAPDPDELWPVADARLLYDRPHTDLPGVRGLCPAPATPEPPPRVPCPNCDAPCIAGVDAHGRTVLLDPLYTVHDLTGNPDAQGRVHIVRSYGLVAHAGLCPRTKGHSEGDSYA